jgi:hypothetical protein
MEKMATIHNYMLSNTKLVIVFIPTGALHTTESGYVESTQPAEYTSHTRTSTYQN